LRGGKKRAKWKRDGTASGRDEGPALLRLGGRRAGGRKGFAALGALDKGGVGRIR